MMIVQTIAKNDESYPMDFPTARNYSLIQMIYLKGSSVNHLFILIIIPFNPEIIRFNM